jgi:4-hydroxy-tetrahydrodipicolinate reductase
MRGLVIVGAGPIGTWVAAAALSDGVVDRISAVIDPDDGARRELVAATGAPGYASTVELPRATPGDAALVAFASAAEKVAPEIIRLVSAGYDVVTTCEGLAWAPRHIWDAMHTSARSDGRTIIVTGSNPGFVMDRLPLLLAGASRGITRIHVERRMDTSSRRPSLVAKSGRGLSDEQFRNGVESGRVGHKGLDSSARLVARGLEWPYHDVSVTIEPIRGAGGTIDGARHRAVLQAGDGRDIVLELDMAWGLTDELDRVTIDGDPPIVVEFPTGYPVDEGTAAHVVGALRHLETLPPGFYRPTDIPLRYGTS